MQLLNAHSKTLSTYSTGIPLHRIDASAKFPVASSFGEPTWGMLNSSYTSITEFTGMLCNSTVLDALYTYSIGYLIKMVLVMI